MSDITVDQLMQRLVTTSEKHLNGQEAVELMVEQESSEIVFVDNHYPESIVTAKDLINYVAEFSFRDTVLVSITGLEEPEEKAVVHNQIRTQLQGSLGRKLKNPEEISLRIKKAEKDGRKHRYDIDLKLYSDYGMITVNESGWDMMEVVDEALNELNSIVREKHDKRTDHPLNRG
jgi:ribosome-associated translation inhibitor RaiA